MEQGPMECITGIGLVFWVVLCVTRKRKYVPSSAADPYRMEKVYKLNRSRLCSLLQTAVAQDRHHLCSIIAIVLHVILTI